MAETPRHYIRIDDDLWAKATAKARSENVTLSRLVRDWLCDYMADGSMEDELGRMIDRLVGLHKRMKGETV